MLRVVGKRSFSTCGAFQGIKRTPTSHLRHSNGAAFKHYRVRFLKPPMFSRRRLGTVILYATPLVYFSYFNSPISVEIVAEDKEVVTEDGSVEFQDEIADEDLEDGLFLPFTWPKPCERTYYKGSDPVWKEYIKFNRDRDRQKEVIDHLVSKLRNEATQHPSYRQALGDVNLAMGRHWIDVSFPRGPPRDYEFSGLEIGDNFIALTTRTLSHEDYQKLVQTIAPTTVAYSFWASCRHLFDLKIKEIFGLPVHSDAQSPFGTQNSGASTEGPVRKPGGSTGAGLTPPGVVPSVGADSSSNIGLPQTPDTSSKEPQSRALSTFLSGLSLNRRPAFTEAPRGSIILSGLVEVVGSKARATMDVTAVYDLASDKYLSINVMGRRIAELKQRPRG